MTLCFKPFQTVSNRSKPFQSVFLAVANPSSGRHLSNDRTASALTGRKEPRAVGSCQGPTGQEVDTILGFPGNVHLRLLYY